MLIVHTIVDRKRFRRETELASIWHNNIVIIEDIERPSSKGGLDSMTK